MPTTAHVLLAIILLANGICAKKTSTEKIDVTGRDPHADTNTVKQEQDSKPNKIRMPVPQVIGKRYVHNLTISNFDEFVQRKPTIVLVAADWCPHCRNYMPDFNIIAYNMGESQEYQGPRWTVARYYTLGQNQRDPIMKKFDLEAVPRILLIKDNRYWVYEGDKTLEKITAFITNLDDDKSKFYPSYIPDFWDDARKFWREILKSIDHTRQQNPEKIDQFVKLAGVILAVFGLLFMYALFYGRETVDNTKKNA